MLELMARGGMRVGEVLNLTPADIQERSLTIQNPKSGRAGRDGLCSTKNIGKVNRLRKSQ